MAITHPVFIQAKADYRPDLVRVDDSIIPHLEIIIDENVTNDVAEQFAQLKDWPIEKALHYIFALNSVNHKFWSKDGSFVRYQNNGKVGALAANEGFDKIYNHLSQNKMDVDLINEDLMAECYGDIPDIDSRIQILKESLNPANQLPLRALATKHFKSGDVTFEFIEKIVELMPMSYTDPYFKKVQLATYEAIALWNLKKGTDVKMSTITVAADYQLPKVLEGVGVLVYAPALKAKIEAQELIAKDSPEEKAIRAATIVASEKIRCQHNLSIPVLDRFLWLHRNEFDTKFHLTETTYY